MPIDSRTGKSYPAEEGVGDLTGPPEVTKSEKKAKKAPPSKKPKDSGMRTLQIDGGTVTLPKNEPYGLERPFKKGGSVGSASKRADGCAQRGKTRGKMM